MHKGFAVKKIKTKDKTKWLDNKKYKHFDNPRQTYIDIKNDSQYCQENTEVCNAIQEKVSNSKWVSKHAFLPFIGFGIKERRISKIHSQQEEIKYLEDLIKNSQDNEKKKTAQVRLSNIKQTFKDNITKIRPIRYASHLDGHIYGFYASQILLPKYEKIVQENDLDKEILAYRTIPEEFKGDSTFHRSSNITMAKEVFEQIIKRKNNCIALAYDLKSFYDTIDHKKLKEAWCRVLGEDKLPDDHYNIYKSLTRYCYVGLKKVCEYFNYKEYCCSPDGKHCGCCATCKTPKTNKLPPILFKKPEDFRKFREWCSKNDFYKNEGLKDTQHPFGIPQGSALSSVLSNIYLLDFDIKVRDFLKLKNAIYRRYCDDIMIVCDKKDKEEIDTFLREAIKEQGEHLKIHDIEEGFKYSKSQVYDFTDKEKIKKQPLQYLGFCFDGKNVLIRGSSLARYYRKAHKGVIATRINVMKKLYELKKKGVTLQEKQRKMYRKKLYEKYTVLGINNFHYYIDRAFRGMDGVDNHKIKHQLMNHLKKIKKDIAEQDEYIKVAWDILNSTKELPDYKDYEQLVYDMVNSTIHYKPKKIYLWFSRITALQNKLKIRVFNIFKFFAKK